MTRALALAERGRGATAPNPVVGAVVVRGGLVLSEGYHRRAGGDHAEVAALRRLGARARGATLYVSLEPCCHVGRTGPCTDAIADAGIARVVAGCRDPNPVVDGRGFARLRARGVRVDVGCLEATCREANRPFFVWIRKRRPMVTLKAAATLDGHLAARDGSSRWITGESARRRAHVLRASHDAVLVGADTVIADDPRLTVRLPSGAAGAGRRPLRVVLDGRLRTPPSARVLRRQPGGPRTLVFGVRGAPRARARELADAGADVVLLPSDGGRLPIHRVLAVLADRDVQALLVEGGAVVHGAFVTAGLVDRVVFFFAPRLLGGGVPISEGRGLALPRALRLGPVRAVSVGDDIMLAADVATDGG